MMMGQEPSVDSPYLIFQDLKEGFWDQIQAQLGHFKVKIRFHDEYFCGLQQ